MRVFLLFMACLWGAAATSASAQTASEKAQIENAAAKVQAVLEQLKYKPAPVAAGGGARKDKPAEPHGAGWGYEGDSGPENWGKLKVDYATCAAGRRQSPIDIRDVIPVDQAAVNFVTRPSLFRISDNGHTLEVEFAPGNMLRLQGRDYALQQMHFHRPSEHKINGKPADMSGHLVFRDTDGSLAVVEVLMQKSTENPFIQTLWNNVPLERGKSVAPPDTLINIGDFLPTPDKRTYFSYMGSLTTPPCTESVLWIVFNQAVAISPLQDAIFARLYPMNARPVQPANDRLVKMSR